jgi:hypothetical protein
VAPVVAVVDADRVAVVAALVVVRAWVVGVGVFCVAGRVFRLCVACAEPPVETRAGVVSVATGVALAV